MEKKYNNRLQSLIRETILEKKNLNEHLSGFKSILTESNENIVEDVFREFRKLHKKGVITEQNALQNAFGSIFGNAGEGVWQYFKVKLAKHIMTKLKIADENSFLGNVIANTFAEIDFIDYPKVLSGDCNFIVKKIAQGIADGAANYFLEKKGYDNALSGIVLQAASESLFSTKFISALESGLVKIVCPLLTNVRKMVTGT